MGDVTIVGVVLAGGESSRMGRDKAFLEAGGESLVARQARLLREAGVDEVLVSGRRGVDYSEAGAEVVFDEQPGLGPLGGIAAAMGSARASHLLVLAVDMPDMRAAFLRRLVGAAGPGQGAIPKVEQRLEPLCAVYPLDCCEEARSRLAGGRRSVAGLARELLAAGRMVAIEVAAEEVRLLRNWNAPAE